VIHDHEEGYFYVLANKYQERLGLFMIRIDEANPSNHRFFIKWKNKLDISDADLYFHRDPEQKCKELIVSYKTIFVNTYSVYVINISGDTLWTVYRHETFQLWESNITSFFIDRKKNYITINKDGINVMSLQQDEKRMIKVEDGHD